MRAFWIAGLVLLLDQASKWLVLETMVLGESVPVLGSFFRLTYIQNPGAVFGMRLGGEVVHLVFASIALVLVAVFLWRLPETERLAATGLSLVLGGALGNVLDRLQFGAVVDFLDFGIGALRWWVFNVADMGVTVGVGLLILSYGLGGKDEQADEQRADHPPGG